MSKKNNAQTILAYPEDYIALNWVAEKLPDEATLAVNSWRWLGETWAAADGGAEARRQAHDARGTGRRALATGYLGTLERRSRRARAGQQPVAVAEDDLGISADIDDQRYVVQRLYVCVHKIDRPSCLPGERTNDAKVERGECRDLLRRAPEITELPEPWGKHER